MPSSGPLSDGNRVSHDYISFTWEMEPKLMVRPGQRCVLGGDNVLITDPDTFSQSLGPIRSAWGLYAARHCLILQDGAPAKCHFWGLHPCSAQ